MVKLHPEIEPLVRLLEDTRASGCSRKSARASGTARRIARSWRRCCSPACATFSRVRWDSVPCGAGGELRASASLSSPDTDRWLPIVLAIDQFKSSQAADVRERHWTMGPVDEFRGAASHKAETGVDRSV